jgi:hypothetical protein
MSVAMPALLDACRPGPRIFVRRADARAQKVAKTAKEIVAGCLRNPLNLRICTRQGSNLQPCDPKSHTLSN